MGVICVENLVYWVSILDWGTGWGGSSTLPVVGGRLANLSSPLHGSSGGLLRHCFVFLLGGFLLFSTPNPHHILPSLLGAGVTLEIGENTAGEWLGVLGVSDFFSIFFFDSSCCLLLFIVFKWRIGFQTENWFLSLQNCKITELPP